MSAPNLLGLTTVTGKTAVLAPTNTETDLIAAVATGHVVHVQAVFCANIHSTSSGWVSVMLKRSGTTYRIAYQMVVPLNAALNVLDGKPLYLEEGDSLRVTADTSSKIEVNAPYEDMS